MAFTGDLDSVELGQVFQVLRSNQKTGILYVHRTDQVRAFHFADRGVTIQYDPSAIEDRIVETLRRKGRFTDLTLRLALAQRREAGTDLPDSLVAIGAVPPAEVEEVVRGILEEDLFDTFFWRGARFEFFEGARLLEDLPGLVDDRFRFNPESIVMEAARRIDEWGVIRSRIPDRSEVFGPVEGGPLPEPGTVQAEILALVDGCRSVEGVLASSARSPFEVEKALVALLDIGAIAPLSPQQYFSFGRQAVDVGRRAEAAHLFERAARFGVNPEGALQEAWRARNAAGDYAAAVRDLGLLADSYLARGAARECCQALREAVAIAPTDLAARERLVQTLLTLPVAQRDGFDAIAEGRAVASILLDLGQAGRARGVLEAVLAASPKDRDAKQLLVAVLTRLNETKRVVQLYESMAEDLAAKDPMGAIRWLQKILLLERDRHDVSERIRTLYRRIERRRNRRRGAAVFAVLSVGLSVIAVVYALYEGNARAALDGIDLDGLRARGEFVQTREALEAFVSRFPLALVSIEARRTLQEVEEVIAERERRAELAARARQEDRAARIRRAEGFLSRAQGFAAEGNLEDARANLLEAAAAGPPDWEKQASIASQAEGIDRYFQEARDLLQESLDHEAKGDLVSARAAIRRLIQERRNTPEAREATLPFRIQTEPQGAQVRLGETVLPERTPVVARVSPRTPTPVSVEIEGYGVARFVLDPGGEDLPPLDLELTATRSLSLPGSASYAPRRIDGLLLLGIGGGRVVALDPIEGEPRGEWTLVGFGDIVWIEAHPSGGFLYAGTDGTVAAIKPGETTHRFRVQLPGLLRVRPTLAGDRIVAALADGVVVGLDVETGQERWRVPTKSATTAEPLAIASGVLVAGADRRLRLFDRLAGTVLREWALPVATLGLHQEAGLVLVQGAGGSVICLDPSRETPVWSTPPEGLARHPGILASARLVHVTDGRLVALDARGGQIAWRSELDFDPALRPVAGAGVVVLVDPQGTLHAFSVSDGTRKWKARTEGEVRGLLVAREGVDVATADRRLLYFHPRTP